jgi:phosphate transport system substrate-binding protein
MSFLFHEPTSPQEARLWPVRSSLVSDYLKRLVVRGPRKDKASMKKRLLAFIMVPLFLAMAICSQVSAQTSDRALRVNGAGMAWDQVQLWADAFMQANPDIRVMVIGSSAGKGFEALFEGNSELALASRVISAEEQKKATAKGVKLTNRLIGYSGMAVMTNPRNPINELTLEQLRQIFTGEFTNWKQVGGPDAPIRCLTRRISESGGAMFFMEEVLHNQPYGPSTVIAENWTSIVKVCSVANDLPIGIGPALIAKGGIKVLGVKLDDHSPGIKPSE